MRQKAKRERMVEEPSEGDHTLHVADGMSGRRRKKKQPLAASLDARRASDAQHGFERPTAPVVHEVEIGTTITVAELAQRMAIKANEVIKALMKMGMMVTINQVLDQDTATLVVEEMGHTPKASERDGDRGPADEVGRSSLLPSKRPYRGRRWSRSWDTSTTARLRCSTTFAARA